MRFLISQIFRPSSRPALRRWLAAEQRATARRGTDLEAEAALGAFFRTLPRPVPSLGFADRVLAAAGIVAPPVVPLAWPLRLGIAVCLILAGLAASYLLPVALGLVQRIAPADVIAAGVESFVTLIGRIDELAALWGVLAHLRQMVLVVATAPPVALSLLAATVAAATALHRMTAERSSQRSRRHVEAH